MVCKTPGWVLYVKLQRHVLVINVCMVNMCRATGLAEPC